MRKRLKYWLNVASWMLRLSPPPRREAVSPLQLAAENVQQQLQDKGLL